MRYTAVALAFVALAPSGAETPVYRSIDDAGYPTLSDRPGGEPLTPVRVNTYRAVAPPGRDAPQAGDAPAPGSYDSLAVLFPGPGATVRANGGALLVEARVVPALRAGHRLVLRLDRRTAGVTCAPASGGSVPTGEGASHQCAVPAMARGPHTVGVEVLDERGAVVERSTPTSFHVQRVALGR